MFWVTRFGTEPPQHQRIEYRWEERGVIAFGHIQEEMSPDIARGAEERTVSTANCLINRAASLVADVGGLYSTMSLGGASSIYLTRWSTGR
jgi:hypothetical protein